MYNVCIAQTFSSFGESPSETACVHTLTYTVCTSPNERQIVQCIEWWIRFHCDMFLCYYANLNLFLNYNIVHVWESMAWILLCNKIIHSDPREGFKKFKSQIVEGETKTGIPGVWGVLASLPHHPTPPPPWKSLWEEYADIFLNNTLKRLQSHFFLSYTSGWSTYW